MAKEAVSAFGGIDILVNNAALMAEIPQVDILDLPSERFDRVMRVNVLGAIHGSPLHPPVRDPRSRQSAGAAGVVPEP